MCEGKREKEGGREEGGAQVGLHGGHEVRGAGRTDPSKGVPYKETYRARRIEEGCGGLSRGGGRQR